MHAQSCPTLCDPMDYNRPATSAHEIPRQEYWRGLPFPSPGDLHDPGIKSGSPALEADFLPYEPPGKPLKWSFCKLFCFTGITELVSGTFSFKLRVVWFCTQSAASAKLLQSCPTLSNPMDCSLPGSSIHGIFKARVLEWGAIAFSVYTASGLYL